jgi:hypothetical protein
VTNRNGFELVSEFKGIIFKNKIKKKYLLSLYRMEFLLIQLLLQLQAFFDVLFPFVWQFLKINI